MLLYNPTDVMFQQQWTIRPPEISGASERHFPPKTFFLPPGEVIEMPDDGAALALEHLGKRGVMPVKVGQDLTELRGIGRYRWYQSLDAEIRGFNMEQEERRARGLPMLLADPTMRETIRRHKALKAELDAETQQILDEALATSGNQTPPGPVTAEDVLAVHQAQADRMAPFDRAIATANAAER